MEREEPGGESVDTEGWKPEEQDLADTLPMVSLAMQLPTHPRNLGGHALQPAPSRTPAEDPEQDCQVATVPMPGLLSLGGPRSGHLLSAEGRERDLACLHG